MNPKVALFDLDGIVIVGRKYYFSEHLHREKGIPREKIAEFFPDGLRECTFGRADLKETIAPYLVKWGFNGTVDDLFKFWFESESTVDKEVLEIIGNLRSIGVSCYIATRQEKYRMTYILDVMGLKDYFDGVFCTYEVGYDKWQKEYWDFVFKKLNLKPEEIIFFCDSQKNIDAANNLGVQAYFYTGVELLKEKLSIFEV